MAASNLIAPTPVERAIREAGMPMYEFDCRECGQSFEELVLSLARVQEVRCPTCDSIDVKKKLSTVAARVPGGTSAVSGAASCAPGGL
jgi:putative FmdB family regulatory protein